MSPKDLKNSMEFQKHLYYKCIITRKKWRREMKELYNTGLTENDIKNMVYVNNDILNLEESEIEQKINYLTNLGCNEYHIRNILVANPWYLSRVFSDVQATINKLNELKFEAIYLMIDSNPLLLNIDVFEIDNFINKKKSEGYEIDDIIDMVDEDPTIITE